ncbi:MAG: hypothetical protein RR315_08560 [Oscillospiraceae bacterium]
MEEKKLRALMKLAHALEGENILWGVGASLLLYLNGITDKFNDIDIVVAQSQAEKVDMALSEIGKKAPENPNASYATRHFYEYIIDGVEVDVMAGFTINTSDGSYLYDFDESSVAQRRRIGTAQIPLCFVEDWYILYCLMEHREVKTAAIERYFSQEGIAAPQRFIKEYNKLSPVMIERLQSILQDKKGN